MYSTAHKRYVTVLLLVVYIFNQTDRMIFGFLMEPIRHELGLSDTQLGFLAGPALALFYSLLGIPVARWADRSHRVNIMSTAIALWSIVTVLTATVGTFLHFTLVRIGVGVGEAGFSAVAQSLIADYHSAAERTRALSIFMLAIPLGVVVSFLMGGVVNDAYGWRTTFVVAGLPGILLAVLLKCTVREPARGKQPRATVEKVSQPSMWVVWTAVWRHRTLRHLVIASAIMNTIGAGMLSWLPTFFIRNHAIPSAELGVWLAAIVGGGGSIGIWLGGYLTDKYGVQDESIRVRIIAAASALVPPIFAIALWLPTARIALLMLLPGELLVFFFFGPTAALVQSLSAANIRATMASVFILIQVLVGGVIGVQLLGVLSDVLTPKLGSAAALQSSMILLSVLAWWAAVHFWMAGRGIRQEFAAAANSQSVQPVHQA